MLFTYRMDHVFSFHQMLMAVDIPRAPGYLSDGQCSCPRVATREDKGPFGSGRPSFALFLNSDILYNKLAIHVSYL